MEKGLFLHFVSEMPFVLTINGEHASTVDNTKKFSCDVYTTAKRLIFSHFPTSDEKEFLPSTHTLTLDENSPTSSSSNIEIIPCGNKHFEIVLTPILIKNESDTHLFYEESVGALSLIIMNGTKGNIYLYENNKIKLHKVVDVITHTETEHISGKLVIKCAFGDNGFYVLVVDTSNSEVIFENYCDSFETSDDTLKVLIKQYDIAKHAKVFEINLNTNNISDYAVYLQQSPTYTHCPHLVPLAFLQAIKVKNFALAKEYLSHDFANISDQHLLEYFGNFDKIRFNKHLSNQNKVCYLVKDGNYKCYEFVISDGKISEIIN